MGSHNSPKLKVSVLTFIISTGIFALAMFLSESVFGAMYGSPKMMLIMLIILFITSVSVVSGHYSNIIITDSFNPNNDPNRNLAYMGAGCALPAIPFNKASDKHAEKAVMYYNSAGVKTGPADIKFGAGSNGIGLTMKF